MEKERRPNKRNSIKENKKFPYKKRRENKSVNVEISTHKSI